MEQQKNSRNEKTEEPSQEQKYRAFSPDSEIPEENARGAIPGANERNLVLDQEGEKKLPYQKQHIV